MSDFTVREYTSDDKNELIDVWCSCFADPPALVEDFLTALPDMGTGAVAVIDGHIVGAAYAVCGMELVGSEKWPKTVGYLFAIAVKEQYRRQGIGEAITKAAAELAKGPGRGARIIALQPAEPWLFDWYRKILGIECSLRRRKYEVKSKSIEPAMSLSATEYSMWRESMLQGKVHIHPSVFTLDFVRKLYSHFNGGLFVCGSGIVTADVEDGVCVIKELLCDDASQYPIIAASVGAALGTQKAVYYLPDTEGEPYVSATPGLIPENCVWNLTMD